MYNDNITSHKNKGFDLSLENTRGGEVGEG